VTHAARSCICVYTNADASSIMFQLYLHYFYNIIFKFKHELHLAPRSTLYPNEKFLLRTCFRISH